MKEDTTPLRFNSLSDLHRTLGLPKPLHPLVTLNDYGDINAPQETLRRSMALDFYKVSYKMHFDGKLKYGQHYYDFNEGGLSFVAPNQVLAGTEGELDYSGYTLLFHKDFIRNYPLGAKIRTYGFFSYALNESLFLSDKEKKMIFSIFDNIREELSERIDDFSQDVMVAHLDLLLSYSNRFYKRQFVTRGAANHDIIEKTDQLIEDFFDVKETENSGYLTVEYLAGHLNVSPRYLSDMLRSLTGRSAQQHIHDKLIEKAKEYLATTNLTVSEIAYLLGFEHSQSLSRVFKKKTQLAPLEFRQSFN